MVGFPISCFVDKAELVYTNSATVADMVKPSGMDFYREIWSDTSSDKNTRFKNSQFIIIEIVRDTATNSDTICIGTSFFAYSKEGKTYCMTAFNPTRSGLSWYTVAFTCNIAGFQVVLKLDDKAKAELESRTKVIVNIYVVD